VYETDIGVPSIPRVIGDAGSKACERVENETHSEYETGHQSNYLRVRLSLIAAHNIRLAP
jgi:hypothetical protein